MLFVLVRVRGFFLVLPSPLLALFASLVVRGPLLEFERRRNDMTGIYPDGKGWMKVVYSKTAELSSGGKESCWGGFKVSVHRI